MNVQFCEMDIKNKKKIKGMESTEKKQDKHKIFDKFVVLDLKEILERLDPQEINKDLISEILQRIKQKRQIEKKEIARMILFMADFPERNWNIKGIMEAIKINLEEINWRDVYSYFLEEDFNIWSLDSLYVIIDCWVCISGIITVPYEIFFKRWKNSRSQIYFIRLIIESDERKTQLYSNVFFKRIVKLEETRNLRFKNILNYESTFNCVELFECIKTLDSNILIEQIAKKAPEWCLLGLSHVYPSFKRFFDELLINFMRGSSSNFVFYILFKNISKIILQNLQKYMSNGISLSKVLDIILEQKMLPFVSEELDPPNICMDIIILSSLRDHLNLGIWLNNMMVSKKDIFANILINYIEFKVQGITEMKSEFDLNVKLNNLIIDKLFPLTVEIIITFIKTIELFQKQLNFETINRLNQLKKQIPQIIKIKKGNDYNIEEQASSFISSIINSQMTIKEGVENIKEMQKGDNNLKELTFRIFSTLIENYTALYKLPNSDLLANFYGELIKNDIIPKPFLKVALSYLKESLRYPETDREFHFAFKCLESFIRKMPKFLSEIETIENVKNNLLKKELILVDENFYSRMKFHELFELCFKFNVSNEHISILNNLKNSKISENIEVLNKEEFGIILFRIVEKEEVSVIIKIADQMKNNFEFVYSCLNFTKILLNFHMENEIEFVKKLGTIIGSLTLARNKIVILEKFDFKKFLIDSIECRRILFSVAFLCSVLKQGKQGKIFVPNNPWLMRILNILSELYSCTLQNVRKEIFEIFKFFNLPLTHTSITNFKSKTRDYLLEYSFQNESSGFSKIDNENIKHVISLAFDFSIREIFETIVENACEIALKTGMALFKTIEVEKGNDFPLFRNLLINLTKSLCYVSSQEPLRACMSGNINYFLKLSSIELTPEEINFLVTNNQENCCDLIERSGVSRISDLINENFKNTEIRYGTNTDIDLEILENTTHVEKIHIKPIEQMDYQEVKSHLLQISRKKIENSLDFVSEEWHCLLGNNSEEEFNRIISFIVKSEDKDLECLKLCKYITGHLVKIGNQTNISGISENVDFVSQEDSLEFLFQCLKNVFKISHRTQKEVLSWLIYSSDPRRFSVKFVSKFIEYQLLNLVEYDQALAKSLNNEENIDFIINLLSNLLTEDVQICTVYDFIATLESLSNLSDNTKVYDFFQKISSLMMLFENFNTSEFEEIVKNEKFNIFLDTKKSKIFKSVNVKSAFKSSWEHFVRHHKVPTEYCFYKIDLFSKLCKNNINLYIKDTLEVFIDAYRKRNYLFIKFICRFFTKLFDIIEDTNENIKTVYDVINILKPSVCPFFTTGWLELIQHKFVFKLFDFAIAEECLNILNLNDKFIYPVTKIFEVVKDDKIFIKTYGIYLSYICKIKFIHLKNIFNRYRDNISYLENQNTYFKIRRLLQNNTFIAKDYFNTNLIFIYLFDNLNDRNLVTIHSSNALKTMINEKNNVNKLITLMWIYYNSEYVPIGLKIFYEELIKSEWVCKIIDCIKVKNK